MLPSIDPQKVALLKEKIASNPQTKNILSSVLSYLPDSEYELILFMDQQKVWTGPMPLEPSGFQPGSGSIELGLFLYWLNNPSQLNLSMFSFKEQLEILVLIAGLDYELPSTKMNAINYNFFANNELIYSDGSVLGTEKWATFDQGWFVAFLNLFQTTIHSLTYNDGVFPDVTVAPVKLEGANSTSVTIAILGDWGTGDTVSQSIMNQVLGLSPDYILHVGDVYYAGTPLATDPTGSNYFSPGEEASNLLAQWPSAYNKRSITLNSNHEMYSGANGLFYDALGVSQNPVGSGTPFSLQQGNSCCALQFGGWTLLCLDTGFEASVTTAFMTGSIGGVNGVQGKWIQSLQLDPSRTIVFTHHNGFADDCSSVSPLWDEIRGALNGDPYAWYWGHVHNGIVYNSPVSVPVNSPTLTTNTFARCCGHSALPYGPASSLQGQPIYWMAQNMQPSSKQLYNGFATLTLTTNSQGMLTSITENYYDLSPYQQPVYSQTIFG